MTDLDDVRLLVKADRGLATVATTREDGTVQSSVVNAGLVEHPITGEPMVGFVMRSGTHKHTNLRARPAVAVTWRAGFQWVTVEGSADIIGPEDHHGSLDADAIRRLIRAVYEGAGGTHDDWETFDRVMVEEHRCAVLIAPERIYGIVG